MIAEKEFLFQQKWRRLANLAIYRDLGESLETTRTDFGPKFNENRTVWSEFLLGVVSGVVDPGKRSKLRPKQSSWQP